MSAKRVAREFKQLKRAASKDELPFVKDPETVGDGLYKWRFKMCSFDDDIPGGRQLNLDLAMLQSRYGQGHLLMEVLFPSDYPHKPFFLRVVSPRCRMYTGHVTAGGSICMEALTTSGTPGSWQPAFTLEALLHTIALNMIDCPTVYVQTPTGPGGMAGPLRVDFDCHNPLAEYSLYEAEAAFSRTLQNHLRAGWAPPPSQHLAPAAPSAAVASRAARCTRAATAAGAAAAAAAPAPAAAAPAAASASAASGQRPPAGASPAAASPEVIDLSDDATVIDLTTASPAAPQTAIAALAASVALLAAAIAPLPGLAAAPMAPPVPAGPANLPLPMPAAAAALRPKARAAAPASASTTTTAGTTLSSKARAASTRSVAAPRPAPPNSASARARSAPMPAAPPAPALGSLPFLAPAAAAAPPPALAAAAKRTRRSPPAPRAPSASAAIPAPSGGALPLAAAAAAPIRRPSNGAPPAAPASAVTAFAGPSIRAATLPKPTRAAAASAAAAGQSTRTAAAAAGAPAAVVLPVLRPRKEVHVVVSDSESEKDEEEDEPDWVPEAGVRRQKGKRSSAAVQDEQVDAVAEGQQQRKKPRTAQQQQQRVQKAPQHLVQLQVEYPKYWDLSRLPARSEPPVYINLPLKAALAAPKPSSGRGPQGQRKRQLQELEKVLQRLEQQCPQGRLKVVAVQRVQNARLWQAYFLQRAQVAEDAGPTGANEQQLFHGAGDTAVNSICHEGFDIRLAGYHCSYGVGTYFTPSASIAQAYTNKIAIAPLPIWNPAAGPVPAAGGQAPAAAAKRKTKPATGSAGLCPLPQGGKRVILARVALGRQVPGTYGLRRPPPGADSVMDMADPKCASQLVVFNNHQAYPEYVITMTA